MRLGALSIISFATVVFASSSVREYERKLKMTSSDFYNNEQILPRFYLETLHEHYIHEAAKASVAYLQGNAKDKKINEEAAEPKKHISDVTSEDGTVQKSDERFTVSKKAEEQGATSFSDKNEEALGRVQVPIDTEAPNGYKITIEEEKADDKQIPKSKSINAKERTAKQQDEPENLERDIEVIIDIIKQLESEIAQPENFTFDNVQNSSKSVKSSRISSSSPKNTDRPIGFGDDSSSSPRKFTDRMVLNFTDELRKRESVETGEKFGDLSLDILDRTYSASSNPLQPNRESIHVRNQFGNTPHSGASGDLNKKKKGSTFNKLKFGLSQSSDDDDAESHSSSEDLDIKENEINPKCSSFKNEFDELFTKLKSATDGKYAIVVEILLLLTKNMEDATGPCIDLVINSKRKFQNYHYKF